MSDLLRISVVLREKCLSEMGWVRLGHGCSNISGFGSVGLGCNTVPMTMTCLVSTV